MLVLTRKTDEVITIGNPTSQDEAIEITVVEIRGGGEVRLGIKAPRSVSVDRKEVREEKEKEHKPA